MTKADTGDILHILLVEDNSSHAELIKRSFEQHKIPNRITHLKDGQTALDYLFEEGDYKNVACEIPHLILLDLRMPRMDGLEVLKQLKTHEGLNKVPVVILSTSASEIYVARAYEFHANSYLVKPTDYDKFSKLITDLGQYCMAWNQDPWYDEKLNPEISIKDLV